MLLLCPYIYFLLTLPTDTKHWVCVLWGFLLGIPLDIFANTPGVTMITLTFCGLMLPWMFKLFGTATDYDEVIEPSLHTMELIPFLRYVFAVTFLQCIVYFSIESFCLFNYRTLIINILSSTVITSLFVVAMAVIRK